LNAIRNIFKRTGRTLLTVTGISLSIGLAICIFSLSAGIDLSIHTILEESGVDVYVVSRGVPVFLQDLSKPLIESRAISRSLLKNPGIKAAGPRLVDSIYMTGHGPDDFREINAEGKLGLKESKIYHSIGRGRVPEMDGNFGGESLVKGEYLPTRGDPFYQNGTYQGGANSSLFTHEIVLDVYLAELLDVGVGDRVLAAKNPPQSEEEILDWSNNRTIHFEVVGILRESYEGSDMPSCVLHLSEMQYLMGLTHFDKATKIFVEVEAGTDVNDISDWIEEESAFGAELSAYSSEELESDLLDFTDVMRSFGGMITIITTFVSIIFVATIVVISIKERTGEIGILKAIGISSRSVVFLFFTETMVICLLGYLLGLLLGVLGVHIVDYMVISSYDSLPPGLVITKITPGVLGKVTVFAFLISILGGVVPSYLITRVPPITAMRRV
jgi:hypothetical protein